MVGGSDVDLNSVLSVLASKKTSLDDKIEAYTNLCSNFKEDELSFIHLDVAKQVDRVVAQLKKDISHGCEAISQSALQILGYCLHDQETVRFISAVDSTSMLKSLCSVIDKTDDKTTCTRALWCISKQAFSADIVAKQVPALISSCEQPLSKWKGQSPTVEYEIACVIARLLVQVPKPMANHCLLWVKISMPLAVHPAVKIREKVISLFEENLTMLTSTKGLAHGIAGEFKSKIAAEMKILFAAKNELMMLRLWKVIVTCFGEELHHGTSLINQLLSLAELGFKHAAAEVKIASFEAWRTLIDNFATNPSVLSDPKRMKLIMQVLKLNNTKKELVAMAQFQTWWHFVKLLGPKLSALFEQVMGPLLSFCLGGSKLTHHTLTSTPGTPHAGLKSAISSPLTPRLNLSNLTSTSSTFCTLQKMGCEVLARILACQKVSSELPAAAFSIDELTVDVITGSAMFLKHATLLIHSATELLCCVGADVPHSLLMYIWQCLAFHLRTALNVTVKSENRDAFSFFLSQFQIIVMSQSLSQQSVLSMFKVVCGLPQKALSSTAYNIKTGEHGEIVRGTPALFLCEVLLTPTLLKSCAGLESYMSHYSQLVNCGVSNATGVLEFCQAVTDLIDQNAEFIPTVEAMWRLWSVVANTLLEHILKTNEVNQGDSLEYNFNSLYTLLLLPVKHRMGSKMSSAVSKTMVKTWSDVYRSFARMAALVPNARANIVCEEFSQKIQHCLSEEDLKDSSLLDFLAQICEVIINSVDFSSFGSTFNFNSGVPSSPSKWLRKKKPMENLQAFVTLTSHMIEALVLLSTPSDGVTTPRQKGGSMLTSAASGITDILTTLFTHVNTSSIISNMLAQLSVPLGRLFHGSASRSTNKFYSPAFMQKLEKLWLDISTCIQSRYSMTYDTDFLCHISPLLEVNFLHPRRQIKNQTLILWNATFSHSAPLTYPGDLKSVLMKVKEKTLISLPGFDTYDVAIIEETPVSQFLQGDSQAPEPHLPGLPSPRKIVGSFLHKAVSPSIKKSPAKPVIVSPKAVASVRKKLKIDDFREGDFVVIQTTPKRKRVLTDHQKEVLKEKKILPTMYSSLDASIDMSLMAQFTGSDTQNSESQNLLDNSVITINSTQSQIEDKTEKSETQKRFPTDFSNSFSSQENTTNKPDSVANSDTPMMNTRCRSRKSVTFGFEKNDNMTNPDNMDTLKEKSKEQDSVSSDKESKEKKKSIVSKRKKSGDVELSTKKVKELKKSVELSSKMVKESEEPIDIDVSPKAVKESKNLVDTELSSKKNKELKKSVELSVKASKESKKSIETEISTKTVRGTKKSGVKILPLTVEESDYSDDLKNQKESVDASKESDIVSVEETVDKVSSAESNREDKATNSDDIPPSDSLKRNLLQLTGFNIFDIMSSKSTSSSSPDQNTSLEPEPLITGQAKDDTHSKKDSEVTKQDGKNISKSILDFEVPEFEDENQSPCKRNIDNMKLSPVRISFSQEDLGSAVSPHKGRGSPDRKYSSQEAVGSVKSPIRRTRGRHKSLPARNSCLDTWLVKSPVKSSAVSNEDGIKLIVNRKKSRWLSSSFSPTVEESCQGVAESELSRTLVEDTQSPTKYLDGSTAVESPNVLVEETPVKETNLSSPDPLGLNSTSRNLFGSDSVLPASQPVPVASPPLTDLKERCKSVKLVNPVVRISKLSSQNVEEFSHSNPLKSSHASKSTNKSQTTELCSQGFFASVNKPDIGGIVSDILNDSIFSAPVVKSDSQVFTNSVRGFSGILSMEQRQELNETSESSSFDGEHGLGEENTQESTKDKTAMVVECQGHTEEMFSQDMETENTEDETNQSAVDEYDPCLVSTFRGSSSSSSHGNSDNLSVSLEDSSPNSLQPVQSESTYNPKELQTLDHDKPVGVDHQDGENVEISHDKKRKQNCPKKMSPSKLRRTPRSRRKPKCRHGGSCCNEESKNAEDSDTACQKRSVKKTTKKSAMSSLKFDTANKNKISMDYQMKGSGLIPCNQNVESHLTSSVESSIEDFQCSEGEIQDHVFESPKDAKKTKSIEIISGEETPNSRPPSVTPVRRSTTKHKLEEAKRRSSTAMKPRGVKENSTFSEGLDFENLSPPSETSQKKSCKSLCMINEPDVSDKSLISKHKNNEDHSIQQVSSLEITDKSGIFEADAVTISSDTSKLAHTNLLPEFSDIIPPTADGTASDMITVEAQSEILPTQRNISLKRSRKQIVSCRSSPLSHRLRSSRLVLRARQKARGSSQSQRLDSLPRKTRRAKSTDGGAETDTRAEDECADAAKDNSKMVDVTANVSDCLIHQDAFVSDKDVDITVSDKAVDITVPSVIDLTQDFEISSAESKRLSRRDLFSRCDAKSAELKDELFTDLIVETSASVTSKEGPESSHKIDDSAVASVTSKGSVAHKLDTAVGSLISEEVESADTEDCVSSVTSKKGSASLHTADSTIVSITSKEAPVSDDNLDSAVSSVMSKEVPVFTNKSDFASSMTSNKASISGHKLVVSVTCKDGSASPRRQVCVVPVVAGATAESRSVENCKTTTDKILTDIACDKTTSTLSGITEHFLPPLDETPKKYKCKKRTVFAHRVVSSDSKLHTLSKTRFKYSDRGMSIVRRSILKHQISDQSCVSPLKRSNDFTFRPIKVCKIHSPSASPSAGILKRRFLHHALPVESPLPPGKERRVSFAEPVVSGESPKSLKYRKISQEPEKSSFGISTVSTKVGSRKQLIRNAEPSQSVTSSGSELSQSAGSYVSTQESQLSSKEPVYPDLIGCTESVAKILPQLTSSMWSRGLVQLVKARNINTVGDLCSLSELEIHNLPIRSPKLITVRRALQELEQQITGKRSRAGADGVVEKPGVKSVVAGGLMLENKENVSEVAAVVEVVDETDTLPSADDALLELDQKECEDLNSSIEDGDEPIIILDDVCEPMDGTETSEKSCDNVYQSECDIHGKADVQELTNIMVTESNTSKRENCHSADMVSVLENLVQTYTSKGIERFRTHDLFTIHHHLSSLTNMVVTAMKKRCSSPPGSQE